MYPKITLSDDQDITEKEYKCALSIIASIREVISIEASQSSEDSSPDSSQTWKYPSGGSIYGEKAKKSVFEKDVLLTPGYQFINHLRLNTFHFSGYRLSNILGEDNYPSWTDNIAGEIRPEFLVGSPDWSVAAFLELTKGLPEEIICKPPLKLGEIGWMVNGGLVNRDVLGYQERIALLYNSGVIDKLKEFKNIRIIEIGGGYGGLAYFLKKIFPNVEYYICDIPMSLYFSSIYLSLLTEADNLIYKGDKKELSKRRNGFTFVPNFFFKDLDSMTFDLAINTLSFAEMPISVVDNYVSGLSKMLLKTGILFEQNFDNSHYKLPTFCNPEPIISKYFKIQKVLNGRWGKATFWGKSWLRDLVRRTMSI